MDLVIDYEQTDLGELLFGIAPDQDERDAEHARGEYRPSDLVWYSDRPARITGTTTDARTGDTIYEIRYYHADGHAYTSTAYPANLRPRIGAS